MNICSSLTAVLVHLLTLAASLSSFTSVMVKLHEAATLPCSQTCAGLVTWTSEVVHMSSKQHDVLVQCDQTSCQSKEGFHMTHDQYQKGDLSLIITHADYTKRTWYTCKCDDKAICDVSLRIEATEFSWQINPGESLTLDIPVSEPVEVFVNKTDEASVNPVQLCEVKGGIQYNSVYETRVMFSLQLKEMKESDSGVYTIWDIGNQETVSTHRVTVGGNSYKTIGPPNQGEEHSLVWTNRILQGYNGLGFGLGVGLVGGVLLGYFVPPFVRTKLQRAWEQHKRKKARPSGDDHRDQSEHSALSVNCKENG
ncbi:uncharacterized protein LOC143509345 [Brachyhypopomus gauderio]|uniref:uncharacterized protein LOC143509345 n=1 Tax=Brachyhypopomus gauderio TaxID=698409 RepID=UPI004042202D